MKNIDITDLTVNVTDLIDTVTQIKEKTLNFPFHSFTLMFIDGGGTHLIRYADIFEESKSAVIHQLKKILKFPQNYFHVNVFVTTVEPPEHDRTYALGKNKKKLTELF